MSTDGAPTDGTLTVGVLGPLQVRRGDRQVPVPSGRTTEVLVRLALEAGQVVGAERLIDDLWGAAATTTGRNTLQSKVSQLRRALGEPDLLRSGHGGYRLQIDRDQVDALRVADLAGAAATARRGADPATALEAAAEALALFRGEALVDAGDGDWLHPHRARLAELRLALLEDHAAARVNLGGGGDVIADLELLVAAHPLREGLWVSLITALYRAGRQADALASCRRVRRILDDELGVEPGPGLRELEVQILSQHAALAAGPGPTGAPGPGGSPSGDLRVGNLPRPGTPLIGRDHDLATLAELAGAHRLVTVVGPAGVGKTRTTIEVACGLSPSGGVWLVRLDAVDADVGIGRLVAETLQLSGGEQTLLDRLNGSPTVLLVDNCEHLVEPVAELVAGLLDRAPTLRVLATSQTPLGLEGEAVHSLDPLPLDEAVDLFAERARRSRRQFTLDDDTTAVVRSLCSALDGLPLAIELAAARARSLSVQDISRRLDDRFTLLADPLSRGPARRRTLAAAIGWSYDLLFPDDQRGLWALATFAGGAPLTAAEHVMAALGVPGPAAVDVVDRLVERSVLSMEPSAHGETRYRLLDSIRLFSLDRLDEAGLSSQAHRAHAEWFAAAADRAEAGVRTSAQADWVRLARAERANLDAALAWTAHHDPELGLRIATGFGWTWVVLGDGVAGAERIRAALEAARAAVDSPALGSPALGSPAVDSPAVKGLAQAPALLLAGWLEASAGNVAQAQTDLDAAVLLAESPAHQTPRDDELLSADCDRHLAFLHIQQGRPSEVLARAGAAVRVYRRLGLDWHTAAGLLLGAFGSIMVGDTATATRDAAAALALLQPIDDSWGLVHAKAMLGAIAAAEHRFVDATDLLQRAVTRSETLGFAGQTALHLTSLGRVRQRAGDHEQAVALLTRATAAGLGAGDLRITATARLHLARSRRARGELEAARELLEQNLQWYRVSGEGDGALLSRCLLASLSAAVTPTTAGAGAAASTLQAVLEDARSAQDHEAQVLALDALARLAGGDGDLDGARELLTTADSIADRIRHVLDEADRTDATAARALRTWARESSNG